MEILEAIFIGIGQEIGKIIAIFLFMMGLKLLQRNNKKF